MLLFICTIMHPEEQLQYTEGPAICTVSCDTPSCSVHTHTQKHPCEVFLQTSGALVWSTQRYGIKTNRNAVLYYLLTFK